MFTFENRLDKYWANQPMKYDFYSDYITGRDKRIVYEEKEQNTLQGVEPIWLEKGLFWLETNKMAEKTSNFHTGIKCILCYCGCFIEMCALIP